MLFDQILAQEMGNEAKGYIDTVLNTALKPIELARKEHFDIVPAYEKNWR